MGNLSRYFFAILRSYFFHRIKTYRRSTRLVASGSWAPKKLAGVVDASLLSELGAYGSRFEGGFRSICLLLLAWFMLFIPWATKLQNG